MAQVNVPITTIKRRRTRTYDAGNDDSDVLQAIVKLLVPAGTLVPTLLTDQPEDGWLLCNGQYVAKADYPDLYRIIRDRYDETPTTFKLPDMRGRMPIGASGLLSLFGIGGVDSVTLTVEQLPAHGHGVIDEGHTHDFTAGEHTHDITDPGHGHDITDPGHGHPAAAVATNVAGAGTGANGSTDGNTGTATTGIEIVSQETGIEIQGAAVEGTVEEATTGIRLQETGGGQPVPILPPYIVVNWMVRT